jgi:PKD repeat protein
MKKLITYFSLCCALMACKDKTLEEVVASEPIFTFKADLDGNPLVFEAGNQNYGLNFITQQDFFGIYNYNSALSPIGCENCGPSIQIKIYGSEEKGPNDLPDYANDLAIGEKNFLTNFSAANNLSFHFFANENNNDLNHFWDFGDGAISTQTNPEHTYENPGSYTVTHTIETEQLVSTTTNFTIEAGTPNSFCSLPFQVNETSQNEFHFNHPFNMPDFLEDETWTIYNEDGQIIFNTGQPQFEIDLPQGDIYTVCLSYENEISGCEDTYCLEIDNTQPGPFNDPGFQIAPEPMLPIISKVMIEYRDATGKLYHSAINENEDTLFEIIESSFYSSVANPDIISRKLKVIFNCTLQSVADPDDQINLQNAEAVIAFEIE